MNLAALLRPLLAFDGLVAVMIMTRDGLPVEMIGHGLRANILAAEVVTVAEAARKSFHALGLGQPSQLQVSLPKHETSILDLENHYLVVIFEPGTNQVLIEQIINNTKEQILQALRG